MARTPGLLNISANFEPAIAEPFDGRQRTPKLADLSTSATFGAYAYIGMNCTVYDDTTNNGLYILNDLPHTTAGNWEKIGAGGDLTIGDAITGGSVNAVLYEDVSGNLANSSGFEYSSSILTVPDITISNANTAHGVFYCDASTGILKQDSSNLFYDVSTTRLYVANFECEACNTATYIPFVSASGLFTESSSLTYNDTTKTFSVGGTSANIEVQSGVTTGNAFFTVLDNLAEAMIFRTSNGDRLGHIVSTNGSESWNFFDISKFDYQGLKIYLGSYTRTAVLHGQLLMYDTAGTNSMGISYNVAGTMNFLHSSGAIGYSIMGTNQWILQSYDTGSFALNGSLAVTDSATDLLLGAYNYRTAGWLIDFRNGSTQTYQDVFGGLRYDGKWILGHNDTPVETVTVKPFPFNKVFSYISSSYTDNTTEAGSGNGTAFNMITSTSDYLYMGYNTFPFGQAYIKIATAGAGVTLAMEYYNGSTWGALTITADGTSNLTQSGLITWTIPANMARVAVNSVTTYWVRIKSSTTVTGTPTAYSVIPCNCDTYGVYAMPNDTYSAFSVTKTGLSKIRAGMSASKAVIGGLLNSNITAVGNVGSGEDDLITYSLPAYSLWTNGDSIECEWWGTYGANTNDKTVKVYFGATAVLSTGDLEINSGSWRATLKVIRTGAATQDCIATLITDNELLVATTKFATATETLSGAVTTKTTGEATDNNDIVCEGFSCKVFNN